MDDETETRIVEKAEYVERAVTVLERKQSLTKEQYLDDREQRAIVEREFQTAIEACLDIAELLIKADSVDVPETNAGKFALLGELGVLPADTAKTMQEAAGFRNVLAHTYGHDIDDERVYWHLQNDLHWFPAYLSAVQATLDTTDA
jgi:uncharacterized protein YutE (UPF0331/DUF86 family)